MSTNPDQPRPRIFISHSAKEDYSEKTLTAISAALECAGFEVYVDRERLKPGQGWRGELFTHMYRSHGAAILFSPSVFESTFVPTEVSILGSRPYADKDFVLVPVLLGGVTRKQVDEKFSAVKPGELQFARDKEPADIAEALKEAFRPLKAQQAAQTPFEQLERLIADTLEGVPAHALRGAAQALGVDLDKAWEPTDSLQIKLARELWQAGLNSASAAIVNHLGNYMKGKVKDLIELLAPSWVNPCSATYIPEVARGERGRRALGVNGSIEFTARMFVRRACHRAPEISWPVVPIAGVWGHEPTQDLAAEITVALKRHFQMEDEEDAFLHEVLDDRDALGEPTFVMFPPPAPPAEVLEDLRKTFPTVTFFLLTGDDPPEAGAPGYFRFLIPGLEKDAEARAWRRYRTAGTFINRPPGVI